MSVRYQFLPGGAVSAEPSSMGEGVDEIQNVPFVGRVGANWVKLKAVKIAAMFVSWLKSKYSV